MSTEPQLHVVLDGLGFPEGPVVLPDGRLAFVDLAKQTVSLLESNQLRLLARLTGSPNGLALGRDGALYVANNGGIAPETAEAIRHAPDGHDGCIQRVSLNGTVTEVGGALPGPLPHRPNDLCFGPDGRLFFTDPRNWEVLPDASRYEVGRIYAYSPERGIELLANIPDFPNGIGVEPGGKRLLIAQTRAQQILAMAFRDGGDLGEPEVWCELPEDCAPDGFCFAADGTLYVAGSVGDHITIVDPQREVSGRIDTGPGSDPTNLCLQRGRLWVTLGLPGKLIAIDVGREAWPLL